MADYTQTRSEYLKIMMGNKNNAPYRPEQMNDLGDTSFDVASLSDEDINSAIEQMAGTQYETSNAFKALQKEKESRGGKEKSWFEQAGDFMGNLGSSILEGILNVADSVFDFGVGIIGGISGGWFGAQNDVTEWAANVMTDDRWINYTVEAADKFNPGLQLFTNIGNQEYWDNYWTWDENKINEKWERNYEGYDWLHKGGNFIGELIPSLVLAGVTGGASVGAQAAIQGGFGFARAYGNAQSQALNEGATFQQSSAYGALSGSIEAAFSAGSAAVGGMLASKGSQGFMKVASNKFAEAMTQRFGKGIGTVAGKAMEIALDSLGEATEETVENLLDPAFKMVYDQDALYNAYGTAENRAAFMQEVGKAALLAAAGSAIAGGFKTVAEVRQSGVSNFVSDYQQEIETSAKYRYLRKQDPQTARDFAAGQVKYAKLQREEYDFQRRLEKMSRDALRTGKAVIGEDGKIVFTDKALETKVDMMVANHMSSFSSKLSAWESQYESVMGKAAKIINGSEASPSIDSDGMEVYDGKMPKGYLESLKKAREVDEDGKERTYYEPEKASPSELSGMIEAIQESDGPKYLKMPVSEAITKDDVIIDVSRLSKEDVERIANFKPDDVQSSTDGSFKYADISPTKIMVFNGIDAGIVEAKPNADGTSMVFVVNATEIPAIDAPLTPKQQVENRYGRSVEKSPASLIIEASNAKEGNVLSYSSVKKTTDYIYKYIQNILDGKIESNIDNVIQKIMRGEELPDSFDGKARFANDTDKFFAYVNLADNADKAAVRDFLASEVLDMEVKIKGTGENDGTYKLSDLLDTNERADLTKLLNDSFDELMANGKTSRYSKLMEEYESAVQSLLSENERIRARAKLAATVSKNFNTLANKLGLNGKPSQVKTILKNASSEDTQIVDMFRDVVKGTNISSRTGLSTSPKAAERLLDFANGYTEKRFGASYLWDSAIYNELQAIRSYASEYTITRDGETIKKLGFQPNTELSVEVQEHINSLFKAINGLLNEDTYRTYQKNQETAGDSVRLYKVVNPAKRVPFVSNFIDKAENLATFAANYIGKENPAYDALITDWTKANGTKLSYQQKYTDATNRILADEGFKPSKGFKFLKKKVNFKGETITLGEAASIYFSALTKEGISNGTNTLRLYNKKTESKSKRFNLDGKSDLDTLRGLFSDSEIKVLERLQKEILGGVMKNDYVSWYEKKYHYEPDVADDYFMLTADNAKANLNAEQQRNGAGMLLGATWGRARARQKYKGAYQIFDFQSQFAKYANDLAQQIGYTNYNDKARVILQTKVEVDGNKVSLNELLGETAPNWSGTNGWERYFESIATDSRANEGMGGLLGKIMRGGQTSVLGLNPRSMAKQWLSDFTVMGDVGIATYLKSKARVPYNVAHYKQIRDFMINAENRIDTTSPDFAEYEPYFALIRERFLNKGAVKGKLSSEFVGGISDFALKGMSFFDEANNVINVWAVAETLAHDYDNLKYGTDANRLQAMKYFTDLVFRTQSNSNAMYVSQLRAGFGQDGGQLRKLLFGMFASDNQNKLQQVDAVTREFRNASQRKKSYQSIIDDVNATPGQIEAAQKAIAYIDKNYSKKAWGKKASGVVAGLALSGVGAALINEFFDRVLAKKDKDGNVRKLSDGLDWQTIMAEAPLEMFVNWIPYVSTFSNAFLNNSDISIITIDRINGIKDAFANVTSALQSGDSSKIGKATTNFAITVSELFGVPLNNVYKYAKGIIRNINESAYVNAFGWMDGLKSNNITSSFKTLVSKNDISSAADVLAISYSLYKTGNVERDVLVEQAKLVQEGFNPIARNIPDYVMNEEGEKTYLAEDQKADFGSVYGKASEQVAKLIKNAKYKSMDSATKAKSIKKIYDLYYELAKYETVGIEPDSRLGKLLAYAGDYDERILETILLIQSNAELTDNRRFTKKEQAVRLVNQQRMNRNQKLLTLWLMGYAINAENKKSVQNYLVSMGFTKKQAEAFLPS